MMRRLGLDIGAKKIGVAIGELMAEELTTLRSDRAESFYEENGRRKAIEALDKIASEEAVEELVVGLPVDEEGRATAESHQIKEFSQILAKETGRAVDFTNETLTSAMAKDILADQGLTPKKAEAREDQLAAQLILQQYIEENS